ncbi:MAG: hypothetical protein D6708_02945 [Candidatus Dadabacteria bacterium]|nr:MAG: hypothetical protein D6708_02945 [Candidatus Dadabacteria bacterium]
MGDKEPGRIGESSPEVKHKRREAGEAPGYAEASPAIGGWATCPDAPLGIEADDPAVEKFSPARQAAYRASYQVAFTTTVS